MTCGFVLAISCLLVYKPQHAIGRIAVNETLFLAVWNSYAHIVSCSVPGATPILTVDSLL